jgi:hypothetical protein
MHLKLTLFLVFAIFICQTLTNKIKFNENNSISQTAATKNPNAFRSRAFSSPNNNNNNNNIIGTKDRNSNRSRRPLLKNQNPIESTFISSSTKTQNNNLDSNQYSYQDQDKMTADLASDYSPSFNLSQEDIEALELENQKHYYQLQYVYTSVKFWREFYIIFGSIITLIGCTLNSLCILIFYKSKLFRNSSFPYYVYVISIVDTLNIFFRFVVPQSIELYVRHKLTNVYHVVNSESNQELYDSYTSLIASDYLCSVLTYFHNSLTLVSVWLMVAVSVERWLVIKFALQTKYMIKLRAFFILLVVFVVIFSFNLFDLSPGM